MRWSGANARAYNKRVVAAVAAALAVMLVASIGAVRVFRHDPAEVVERSLADAAAALPIASNSPSPSSPPTPATTKPPSPTPSRTVTRPAPAAVRTTAKKGVAVWQFPAVSAGLKAVGASWYYNWSPSNDRMPAPTGVQFVPMIWGAKDVTDAALAKATSVGDTLLAFNEPDMAGQANLTPAAALQLWPRLQATGRRLGSPAVAWGAADSGRWLDQFMTGAGQRGFKIDFIALHWYGGDFSAAAVGQLKGYLQQVYAKYKLPIWLTEFALIRFDGGGAHYPTDAQQVAFINGATDMLQGLSYVERYAWFGLPATADSRTGLYRENRSLTPAGQAYRAAG